MTEQAPAGSEPQTGRLFPLPVRRFFANLGPGLITGAADDDPSGISTYSTAGAAFGYGLLWTALFSWPLMSAVQLMCARIGVVSGRGLASVLRRFYSRRLLWGACALVVVANTVNIAADLAAMGEGMEMLTGINSLWLTPAFAACIIVALVFGSYRTLVSIFKWLTLVLFAYVASAFLARPDWPRVIEATLVPRLSLDHAFLMTFVGILGTTISPYLFFWQAAQEVEEEKAAGRKTVGQRMGATAEELGNVRTDVLTGMLFSNVVMYFIILTTAVTLHAAGLRNIETAQQAALALRPLAGEAAFILFALGLIGTGFLGVPVLAGSAAYAVAEAAAWRGGMNEKLHVARRFYGVLALAMIGGMLLDYVGVGAIRMLFIAAVLNGVLAPPLIAIILVICNDRRVMKEHVNGPLLNWLGWICAGTMTLAAAGMVVDWLR